MNKIQVGDLAPDFTAFTQHDEKTVALANLRGKNVVLYFYPKDNTPFCTIEAKRFNELKQEFDKLNTVILGVSKDNVKSHKKFATSYSLEFDLLADVEGEICQKYNVWVEKSMFGKKYMGVQRATYLIDTEGKIVHMWPSVNVNSHAQEVLNILSGKI
jgi:thioredoxin-dependent peroxiredoxin